MNRIKINLPETFAFSTTLTIRITDLNYGGHVGNDTLLSLLQEARQQYLQLLGYGELNFEGYGLIMADAAVEYKKELSAGDQITIELVATDFDKLGFDIFYLVTVSNGTKNLVAAKAKTGMICYDYVSKKKTAIPAIAIEKLTNHP